MLARKIFLPLLLLVFFLNSPVIPSDDIPPVPREMRGVWVATVANIDWPSQPGLSVEVQKQEALAIIQRVAELNMNAVVLQVRPQCDAIYQSDLEPWSYYLTGEQGKAPEPFYDPLEFWINECHSRGIELHAWLNPYRANHSAMRSEISPKSIVKQRPDLVKKLGDAGYYWMNPALKESQDHTMTVILDIINRYDVDAIHFDDYFYPYRDYNNGNDFPDDDTYAGYVKSGGKLSQNDWRRDAINQFVKRVYEEMKKEKPHVKFGISPYGIYKVGVPPEIQVTFDQYDGLYADAKLWLNEGWFDYYVPQLYWNISRIELSYPVLLNWWKSENRTGKNLWIGLFIRPEIEKKEMALEIVNQVMVARGMLPESPGTMSFSMRSLMPADSAVSKALTAGPFRTPAIIPAYPWLDNEPPESPAVEVKKEDGLLNLSWSAAEKEKPFLFILSICSDSAWSNHILPANTTGYSVPLEGKRITAVAVSSVDRCGNESKKTIVSVF
ncbi:MAG TPA: family 10 glycosylhydrolase [Ignavibacteriaceae bacterium]|nr:family 10 glycosylhydrolase [Ignavibacteriaceae bacterium]